jgi:hypothetical protein
MKMRKVVPWTVALMLVLITIAVSADFIYHQNRIFTGVILAENDLGGKTKDEARETLSEIFAGDYILDYPVQLEFERRTWDLSLGELGVTPDVGTMLDTAFGIGREQCFLLNYPRRYRLYKTSLHLPPAFSIDIPKFAKGIAFIREELFIEPENARFSL